MIPPVTCPRLVISAPQGRSGKTTISVGLVAALSARGLAVQPFKKGPDYIDPSWLTGAGTRACRNLDLFMMGEEGVDSSFRRAVEAADIAIVEGAMGLYDGLDLEGTGSTAQVARLLQAPVALVVSASRMTRSVAAMVQGYQRFEAGVNVAGVVLNDVARSRHETMLVAAIERYCGIPVLGSVPRSEALEIPNRHLGLVPRQEDERLAPAIEAARQVVERNLNLDAVLNLARSAPPLMDREPASISRSNPVARIAVLRDRVFTFYYPENLEALERAGAELVYVDSLVSPALPKVDALYVGGGFPELFMEQLEANAELREDIRRSVGAGLPVYAECAGLIYLSRRVSWGDRSAEMVGVLPCDIEMTDRPQGHGYSIAEVVQDSPFFRRGELLRGHEFHNTRVVNLDRGGVEFGHRLSRGSGITEDHADGMLCGSVLASYTHLHAMAAPRWAERFVEAAVRHK